MREPELVVLHGLVECGTLPSALRMSFGKHGNVGLDGLDSQTPIISGLQD
jgi:hypothetical protein